MLIISSIAFIVLYGVKYYQESEKPQGVTITTPTTTTIAATITTTPERHRSQRTRTTTRETITTTTVLTTTEDKRKLRREASDVYDNWGDVKENQYALNDY